VLLLWQPNYLVSINPKQAQVLQTPLANVQLPFILPEDNQKLSHVMRKGIT